MVGRALVLLVVAAFLVASCTPAATREATPSPTPDIKRAILDIVYSAIADTHIAKPTSRELLSAALDAIKAEAKRSGGNDDVVAPQLSDVAEPVVADFKRFADAAGALAAKNRQLTPERIADAAIRGMFSVRPDCHLFITKPGGSIHSLPTKGGASPARPNADEAGLSYRMLPGGIAYLTWAQFRKTGTYDIHVEVRRALDALLAQGARAWLFDLRANSGGDPPQLMASWFLSGEPMARVLLRNGDGGVIEAKKDLRLPDAYQLPLAILTNGSGGSAPEHLALYMKETKRAVIVGQPGNGCLSQVFPITLTDGTFLSVPQNEVAGVSGARYSNLGVPPDVPANDATAIETAAGVLRDLVAKGRLMP